MHFPRFPWQNGNNMVSTVPYCPDEQKTGFPILERINYGKLCFAIQFGLCIDEPEEMLELLDDLRAGVVYADYNERTQGPTGELAGLKNALICLHDVFKAYAEHHFPVPDLLVTMCQKLEGRRAELDPRAPPLVSTTSDDTSSAGM